MYSAPGKGVAGPRVPARHVRAGDGRSGPARRRQSTSGGLSFKVESSPTGAWTTDLHVVTPLRAPRRARAPVGRERGDLARRRADLERWFGDAPRLECDWEPLRATYQRSLVDLAALRFSPAHAGAQPAGRRAAVVHDDVRPRQHLHQPAGAAVHARAGGHDAARARRCARARASTTSATRSRARSCTRCATAS